MTITCPNCAKTVPSLNVDVDTATATCTHCGEFFDISDQLPGGLQKRIVPTPDGFSLSQEQSELVITRRWYTAKYAALLIFAIIWDGFLLLWFTVGFRDLGVVPAVIGSLLHLAAGIGLTYTAIAGYINRTEFRISDQRLLIRHAPLPWLGSKVIPAAEIGQLFCRKWLNRSDEGDSVTYDLNVVLTNGTRLTLLKSLNKPDQALFLEQQIEQRLGITDRPVPEEMLPI